MALFNTHRARFFDKKGDYNGKKGFNKNKQWFNYKEGAYNINLKNSSFIEDNPIPFLWKRRTYFYNKENANPILMDGSTAPTFTPELYNINLETKVARDLNNLYKKGLGDLLTPKNIIIVLVLGAIIYYFATGGKLT